MLLLSIFFYLSSILFGVTATNFFFDKKIKEIFVKYAFAFPIGFFSASYMVVAFEAAVGQFNDYFVLSASLIMCVLSYVLYSRAETHEMFKWRLLKNQISSGSSFYGPVVLVFILFAMGQVVGLYTNAHGIVAGGNYGTDVLFHIGMGNALVYHGWPPTFTYANGAPSFYPFITDFYTSILMFNGVSPVISFYMMNLALWFSVVVIGIYFISLITKNRTAAVFGFLMFILCSLALNIVIMLVFNLSTPLVPNFSVLPAHFDAMWAAGFQIFNFADPLVNNFEIQHDILLGFPYALIILTILYMTFFDKKGGPAKETVGGIDKTFVFLGLMAGLMPLVSPISLIFVFIFAVVAFAYSMIKQGRLERLIRCWIPFGAVAIALGVPEILFIRGAGMVSDFSGLVLTMWAWYSPNTPVLSLVFMHALFWIQTLGPLLVLGIVGLYFFRKRWVIFVPALIAFLMVNIIRLSVSFGDSNKITLYFLLFMAASASVLMAELWKRNTGYKLLVGILFIFIVIGGVAQVATEFRYGPSTLASNVELNATTWLRLNTSSDAGVVINCYSTVLGPTSSLGTKRTLLEDQDYVGLEGISNYSLGTVEPQIQNFMANPSCGLMTQYNLSYVVLYNLSTFAPVWCVPVNYPAFNSSTNFTFVKGFHDASQNAPGNILIYKSLCG